MKQRAARPKQVRKKKNYFKHAPVFIITFALIILFFISGVFVPGSLNTSTKAQGASWLIPDILEPLFMITRTTGNSLKLGAFFLQATVTPTPGDKSTADTASQGDFSAPSSDHETSICQPESAKRDDCSCPDGQYIAALCPSFPDDPCTQSWSWPWWDPPGTDKCIYMQGNENYQTYTQNPNCTLMCVAKPVVYLYPPHEMKVDVEVKTTGKVVVSDPHYPEGGWKDVTAHPDGKLQYRGKEYRELFYETSVAEVPMPEYGIVVPAKHISQELHRIVTALGFIGREKDELLSFWVPRLEALPEPYLFISIIDEKTKKEIDELIVNPQPDTVIAHIFYFKPLTTPIEIESLPLPDSPPERYGFTVVEWGGAIARN